MPKFIRHTTNKKAALACWSHNLVFHFLFSELALGKKKLTVFKSESEIIASEKQKFNAGVFKMK